MSNLDLAVRFFLQIALILFACRAVGALAKRCGQPQVVAEMITGVMLGPSLLGALAPDLQQWMFPWDPSQQMRDTSCYLFPASQLGLALYMFVVGMEFQVQTLRRHWRQSVAVSLAGMAVPFLLGAALAAVLHAHTSLFPARTSQFEAMLFLGASMCITAFPMLARIIHFKGLAQSLMGTVALGAGAIDDASAWILLAVVLASFDDNPAHALVNLGGALGFLVLVLGVVKPLLARFAARLVQDGAPTDTGLTLGLALMALGAWFTDLIHLHAVFGAFVMGTAMPRGLLARGLIERIQPLAVGLLLPLFFTYSGLNTRMGLLDSPALWAVSLAILVAAIAGKWLACTLAARLTGLPAREAMGIGILMNARGLMELIIINVGLARGIITADLFAALVIMAIVTTLMASPIFERLVGREESPRGTTP